MHLELVTGKVDTDLRVHLGNEGKYMVEVEKVVKVEMESQILAKVEVWNIRDWYSIF